MKIDTGRWFIGVRWDKSPVSNEEWCWAHVQLTPKDVRHIGYTHMWFDGPIHNFGLWFINFSLRWAPKAKPDKGVV